jgi:hypothetical protein
MLVSGMVFIQSRYTENTHGGIENQEVQAISVVAAGVVNVSCPSYTLLNALGSKNITCIHK